MAFQAKRKFQRSVQRDAVKILSQAGLEYATYEDLSAGGLKLWMDHEMSPNANISLEFSVYDAAHAAVQIKAVGRVVRCSKSGNGYEVGIQFVNLSEPTRLAIQKLFQTNEGPF